MSDTAIFLLVVGARFLVPLAIPRYPLPAILTALVIDGIDQTIFQTFTSLNLDGYQSYDKALDIYYLTIAYVSTLRNWPDGTARNVATFLWYYRLFGVLAFELLDSRWLLLIFPNTFEYFFIFYEAVRLRWDPNRMSRSTVIRAAAFIWIFIKLPQEYWIHIAQLDTTDLIRANPWIVPVVLVVVVLIGFALLPWIRRLPPADRSLNFEVAPLGEVVDTRNVRLGRRQLLEKVVLLAMVCVIFAQILPGVEASNLQVAFGVGALVVANAFVSEWIPRRGADWLSSVIEFLVEAAVNIGLVFAFWLVLGRGGGTLDVPATLFFVLLVTLIVMLFDRYYRMRLKMPESARAPVIEAPAPT